MFKGVKLFLVSLRYAHGLFSNICKISVVYISHFYYICSIQIYKMSSNKKEYNLDISIAVIANICYVFENESVTVTFSDDEGANWEGDFKLFVHNSNKKNTTLEVANAIQLNSNELILTIEPETQGLEPDTYYYEIFNDTTKRVEFMGDLEIRR